MQIPAGVAGGARRPLRGAHHRGVERGHVPRPREADRRRSSARQSRSSRTTSGRVRRSRTSGSSASLAASILCPPVTARAAISAKLVLRTRPGVRRRLPPRLRRCRRAARARARFRPRLRARAVLVLNGWVDWADGSTFLAASQRQGGELMPPYLQVKDARGRWKTVIDDLGMPSGKTKTIAVDLTGKWLSSSRAVRIVTNLCVYWDEIFLSEGNAAPEARLTDVCPRSMPTSASAASRSPSSIPSASSPSTSTTCRSPRCRAGIRRPASTRGTGRSANCSMASTTGWWSWARATS